MLRRVQGRCEVRSQTIDHEEANMAADGPLLICYDGSEDAKHAITSAGRLLGGRHALVLTVWESAVNPGGYAWLGADTSTVNFAELDRAAAEHGGRITNQGVRIALEAGLGAEPITIKATGPVWKTILEIADREDAPAIVMGCRGLTGVRSLLLGSVSSAVIHHAERPTLVVHRPSVGDVRANDLALERSGDRGE
jgi:nucleotide-binding universal stress UspA family protein